MSGESQRSASRAQPGWVLTCTAAEFERLRGDERFVQMLRFARAANSLRFAVAALTDGEEDGSPQRRRQRLNAFMLLAGVVVAAVRLAAAAGRSFADSPAYAAGFGALLDDAGARAYAEDVLGVVAARAPFDFMGMRPAGLQPAGGDVVLGGGVGRAPGAFHYLLADEMVLRGAIDLPAGDVYDSVKEHFESAVLLADRCADAADRLIAELLREQPWRLGG